MSSDSQKSSGLFARLKKTRAALSEGLAGLFAKEGVVFDDTVLEDLEDQLIMADLGPGASAVTVDGIRRRAKTKAFASLDILKEALIQEIASMLDGAERSIDLTPASPRPLVIMMVGVNGVGKTTTTAKIAARYKSSGHSVMLAACDTFRAAAIEQLQLWGDRLGVPVIAQSHGADAAAVAHDALSAAKARGIEVLLIDSAGRQHVNSDLMAQLEKIKRVLAKVDPDAPHEILLVVDGGTGQNAIAQAKAFHEHVGLSGVCVTKLDGTARGGVVVGLASQLGLSVPFIGLGEGAEDLQPFDGQRFAEALLGQAD